MRDIGEGVLIIDRTFVQQWAGRYDEIFKGSYDQTEEAAIRQWLSTLREPKYLHKVYFVRLGRWKTKRQTSNYMINDESRIVDITKAAYRASDSSVKLGTLKTLRGVGVAVAGTILHYFHPDTYPIFDYHARNTLKRAGLWKRETKDASDIAWLEYVELMRDLSAKLGVTLRDLDKALFAYDKYPHRTY